MVKVVPLLICVVALGVAVYFAFFFDDDSTSGIENCPLFKNGDIKADGTSKEPGPPSHGTDCPYKKNKPHIRPGMSLSSCPMLKNGKCPYVKSHTGGKCVCDLNDTQCPHLSTLKSDRGEEKGQCPYYDPSQIDEASNGKCKYMQQIKDEGKSLDCPCAERIASKKNRRLFVPFKAPKFEIKGCQRLPKIIFQVFVLQQAFWFG